MAPEYVESDPHGLTPSRLQEGIQRRTKLGSCIDQVLQINTLLLPLPFLERLLNIPSLPRYNELLKKRQEVLQAKHDQLMRDIEGEKFIDSSFLKRLSALPKKEGGVIDTDSQEFRDWEPRAEDTNRRDSIQNHYGPRMPAVFDVKVRNWDPFIVPLGFAEDFQTPVDDGFAIYCRTRITDSLKEMYRSPDDLTSKLYARVSHKLGIEYPISFGPVEAHREGENFPEGVTPIFYGKEAWTFRRDGNDPEGEKAKIYFFEKNGILYAKILPINRFPIEYLQAFSLPYAPANFQA